MLGAAHIYLRLITGRKMDIETKPHPTIGDGTAYSIGMNSLGFAVFHTGAEAPTHSYRVVEANVTLSLSNIPKYLQGAFGIGDSEIVTTVGPVDGTNHSTVMLRGGYTLPLSHFARREIRAVLAEG